MFIDNEQINEYIKDGITWVEHPLPHDAKGYIGIITKARFVLASFDLEPQGFPPGSRGYDGTCTVGGVITRLTPAQAQHLFDDAETKTT